MIDQSLQSSPSEYLSQLIKDKKQLAAFPNIFSHLERILDEGVLLLFIY
jgi:hypothetical protein